MPDSEVCFGEALENCKKLRSEYEEIERKSLTRNPAEEEKIIETYRYRAYI